MPKEDKIKIVTLNNKSRKGEYVYVRKHGHTHYYKVVPDMEPKGIVKHYLKQLEKIRTKGTQAGRKLLKPERIETQFKPGMPTIEIKDSRISTQTLHKMKVQAFKKYIKNKKLLDTTLKDHNLEKVKQRFEVIATIMGDQTTLATISKTGITPDQAIKEIKTNLKPGEELEESPGMREMNERGWTGKLETPGTINKINVKIIFRKQK